jgi:hypothetical protein
MTVRLPVSKPENTWYDSQPVDAQDLLAEQTHNDAAISGIVNNHFGSGVLPLALNPRILFDSALVVGLLDGLPLAPTLQPTDPTFGVQLEVTLRDAKVLGRRTVKVAIIGLDKDNALQYDTFYFYKNESQITAKHYTNILSVLINDMTGPEDATFNLGGHLVIQEALPFSLSRDTIMVAQDQQPNLFFRDFYVKPTSDYTTLTGLLQAAVGTYSVDALGIVTSPRQVRKISTNDLSTQIGQKFQAKTNNIQKITLLLGVESISDPTWSGDLVLSLYPLQSADASTDPAIAIAFTPSPSPIAQISFNSTTLADNGIVLSSNPQPVDFVLSNTIVGSTPSIIPGNFYAFTIKRSGTTSQGNITISVGNDLVDNSIETIYNGTSWVDVAQEDLWFRVWTSAVKISDGQAYDLGVGIELPKVALSSDGSTLIDNSLRFKSLPSTREYVAVAEAVTTFSSIVQDQRTGNPVASRKEFTTDVALTLKTDFEASRGINEPIVLGAVADRNTKNVTAGSAQTFTLGAFTFSKNEFVVKLIGDTNSNALRAAYLNGSLVNAKILPNVASPSIAYRVAKAELFSMTYGDMNGDGVIDRDDLITAAQMQGMSFAGNTTTTQYTANNTVFADATGIQFQLVDVSGVNIFPGGGASNYLSGNLVSNSADRTYATFTVSASTFAGVTDITSLRFKTHNPSNVSNDGTFIITANPTATTITIHKILMTSDTIMQIMRGSIGNTNSIQPSDVVAISNHVDRVFSSATTGVGFSFQAMRISVEALADRNDDLSSSSTRNTDVHAIQDIALTDSTIMNHDYTATSITFSINSVLSWSDSAILLSGKPRQVNCAVSDPTALERGTAITTPVVLPLLPPSTAFTFVPSLVAPTTAPGRNDLLVPNNLILGDTVLNRSGGLHKFDIEVGTIVLEAPVADFTEEKTINITSTFIASTLAGNVPTGITASGYAAMRFADGTFVTNDAIGNNQIQFAVSMQSYYPNLDAVSAGGNTGIVIDETTGVTMDYTTGILSLNFTRVANDPILSTLRTKIQIVAYLKKAGFNNKSVVVNSVQLSNLLGL